jgi:serine/threonine protein phosphatase PrpC
MPSQVVFATDVGLRREHNEDSVLVWQRRAGVEVLLLVADGIGGHAAGQLASRLTVETFAAALEGDGKKGGDSERLRLALMKPNARVLQTSQRNAEVAGMGSTLVAVAIDQRRLWLVNVGDSSASLFRGGDIHPLSEDHSLPAELARHGLIGDDEVRSHGMKHVLARAIGQSEKVEGYYSETSLQLGDLVVLWTDGIEAASITAEEVRDCLATEDLAGGVSRVMACCRERGAPDNVSLAVVRLE